MGMLRSALQGHLRIPTQEHSREQLLPLFQAMGPRGNMLDRHRRLMRGNTLCSTSMKLRTSWCVG